MPLKWKMEIVDELVGANASDVSKATVSVLLSDLNREKMNSRLVLEDAQIIVSAPLFTALIFGDIFKQQVPWSIEENRNPP